MPDQNNNANEVPRWFSDLWVPEFFLPPEKIFAQKMLSLAHIGLAGSFGALLVGACGARAVYRKTPIYFMIIQCYFIL